MTTFVGTQEDFTRAIKELLELEYDALDAYNVAISKLENLNFKTLLESFKVDHEQHITRLSTFLSKYIEDVPKGPCAKQWLTKGKVILANTFGDRAIIMAMISNELDTNKAYENMIHHPNKWSEATGFLSEALMDERRHKASLEKLIE